MSKTTILITALSFVAAAFVPLASADEAKADCQPNQQWIGYTTSDSLRVLVQSFIGANTVTPCEGEHWDGQDTAQPTYNPGTGASCSKAMTNPNPTLNDLFVGSCMDPNMNNGGADLLSGNGQPVTFRVSSVSKGGNHREVFIGLDIYLVGRTGTYAGQCSNGEAGLEGQASCGGKQQRVAWYGRDNTPGNVLATVISAAGITKGHPSEGDCNQTTYAQGANTNNRDLCGRDNTAITVQTLLP